MKILSLKIVCLLLLIIESLLLFFEIIQNIKYIHMKKIQDKRLYIRKR